MFRRFRQCLGDVTDIRLYCWHVKPRQTTVVKSLPRESMMVAPVGALPSMEPLLAVLLTGLTCTVQYSTVQYSIVLASPRSPPRRTSRTPPRRGSSSLCGTAGIRNTLCATASKDYNCLMRMNILFFITNFKIQTWYEYAELCDFYDRPTTWDVIAFKESLFTTIEFRLLLTWSLLCRAVLSSSSPPCISGVSRLTSLSWSCQEQRNFRAMHRRE